MLFFALHETLPGKCDFNFHYYNLLCYISKFFMVHLYIPIKFPKDFYLSYFSVVSVKISRYTVQKMVHLSKKTSNIWHDIVFFVISVFFCWHFVTDSKKEPDITKKNIFPHRMVLFLGRITTKKLAKTVKTTINSRGCKKKLGGWSKCKRPSGVILTVLQNFI